VLATDRADAVIQLDYPDLVSASAPSMDFGQLAEER